MRDMAGKTAFRMGVRAGDKIGETILKAIHKSCQMQCPVTFFFNDVAVTTHPDSKPLPISRDVMRALNGYIEKNVGPYPAVDLSDEEKANDAKIEAVNEKKREKNRRKYEKEARSKRTRS